MVKSLSNTKNMKKIYIKPENTVVAINVRENLMDASQGTLSTNEDDKITLPEDFGAREVIKTPDAWEEW
jgi:hypothetical protein